MPLFPAPAQAWCALPDDSDSEPDLRPYLLASPNMVVMRMTERMARAHSLHLRSEHEDTPRPPPWMEPLPHPLLRDHLPRQSPLRFKTFT